MQHSGSRASDHQLILAPKRGLGTWLGAFLVWLAAFAMLLASATQDALASGPRRALFFVGIGTAVLGGGLFAWMSTRRRR